MTDFAPLSDDELVDYDFEMPPPKHEAVMRVDHDEHGSVGLDRSTHELRATCRCGESEVFAIGDDAAARAWWDEHHDFVTAPPLAPAETPGETPAATLRRAAGKVRELAEATGVDSWRAEELGVDAELVWTDLNGDEGLVGSDLSSTHARFAGAFGPQVAEPLAAWLDWEADEQEKRTEECVECRGSGEVFDGDPLPFDCTDCVARRPLALARALLGSPVPVPDGEAS